MLQTHVDMSVCLAALLYPTVYNIYSKGLALTCEHGSITLYSNSPEVLRRDSQVWRFQMTWDGCICVTCFREPWPCQRIEVICVSPLPSPVLRAGHVLSIRHWSKEAGYDMAPQELLVYVYINVTNLINVIII